MKQGEESEEESDGVRLSNKIWILVKVKNFRKESEKIYWFFRRIIACKDTEGYRGYRKHMVANATHPYLSTLRIE